MYYIFEVRMRPGYPLSQYASAWLRASQRIQRATGALGTRLHRDLNDPSRGLAIASWDSKAARDAMDATPDALVDEIIAGQAEIAEVRIIGEFAFPDWEVLPGDTIA